MSRPLGAGNMQRRAAAAYVVLFLVIAAGAYAVIATAQAPTTSMDPNEATYSLSQGDELRVDGRTYRMQSVSGSSATLAWTNESAVYTETWPTDEEVDVPDAVTIDGTSFDRSFVVTLVETGSRASLRETIDVPTRTIDEQTYAFVDRNNDNAAQPDELIPVEEYVDREVRNGNLTQLEVTDGQIQYDGTATRVDVTDESVALRWRAPRVNTVRASHASNVTLNRRQLFGYFTSSSTLSLYENPEGWEAYRQEVHTADFFHERINGLWAVTLLSLISAILLSAAAFLPRRDT
jgi:hypothetical protein